MRTTLIVLAMAITVGSGLTIKAKAQSSSFCMGKVEAVSFWSEVQSASAGTSRVTYWTMLRNKTAQPVSYALLFNNIQSQGRANGTGPAAGTLSAWGTSVQIRLGVDSFGNSTGNGRLNERYDLPTMVTVTCK